MTVAEIIVDVPTMQTNRPFEYSIPEALNDVVVPGMRVEVPFGRGKRKIQGFVMKTKDQSDFKGKLKPISRVIDLKPVLSNEMLQLSYWLADKTYSFQISCLQTMLPSVMRAKYKQYAIPLDKTDPEVLNLFQGQATFEITNSLTDSQIRLINRLRKNEKIDLRYVVENKAQQIKRQAVMTDLNIIQLHEAKNELRGNAKSQVKLLDFLIQHLNDLPVEMSELQKNFGIARSAIKTAEKNKLLKIVEVTKLRKPEGINPEKTTKLELTDEQQVAVDQIGQAISREQPETFLIEGVTGSGKTEVYLQTIEKALQQDKTALMLVPEISLTPQMVNRVVGRFGNQVAVLHSGLSSGERYDEWTRIENGDVKVVVGARSAVFAPLQRIGLIIIDEEHEASYKQDDNPRYNARDVALWRSKVNHCPVVLGSATPSLESRARAEKGVYHLIRMKKRINNQNLPHVQIVDMRDAENSSIKGDFSPVLKNNLQATLENHDQAIILLNRRGYSSFMMCRECGFVLKCPNCDVSLTYHKDLGKMKCHYCGHEEPVPNSCPNCRSKKIGFYGTGTQNIEQQLNDLFPEARVLRMDVDTTRRKGAHAKILQKFGSHQADILLGTQMIAKGLDFPDVTLVGVINADTTLSLADFRASERTFQLLTQVSGRAGRAKKTGRVVIQTFNPDHYAIKDAAKQDYETFFKQEMYLRHQSNYTPYYFTTLISVANKDEGQTLKQSYWLKKQLQTALSKDAILLGPSPTMISRKQNKYYYQIIVKYKHEPKLHDKLLEILNETQADAKKGFTIAIDNEPQHID
ncbi:primosomal protein N' [Companilactobacillus alimentarius]|uniref:Replication restart protein PriA n=1 Tax=Companilactobacillus alimentarius DSM 20249 TaxID=1423720 RepID=A0A2K9HFU4_9LACO|nr:primosomal protein N' [Companilactobacillus alimentarius]AUI71419.1 primosomal protein N' [Companilactobacillus alimentarius DSM 20249]GEO44412.1 primosomal protein N' [Companilactobacillus alimentarius]